VPVCWCRCLGRCPVGVSAMRVRPQHYRWTDDPTQTQPTRYIEPTLHVVYKGEEASYEKERDRTGFALESDYAIG
jgi:hypothetical protein